tara:strand:- start:205 stop:387 length:183 start_codon:yes stop_codon:yes gene_type:complete
MVVGVLSGAIFYFDYVILKEIIMIFPYNYMEYLAGDIEEDDLKWPSSRTRDSLDYAKLDE